MTVSYQYEVASSTSGGFTRLLFMWRGSLYKLIYRELILFIGSFGVLSALYRHAFNDGQKRIFEKMVVYCDTFINLIPLSFVLGFYVAYVAGRWWQQYMAIPWPDKIMHSIALYVNGNDEHGRMVRRTLMRYLNVTLILVLRSISSAVKRRFPTLDHVVESGFMTTIELQMYQSVPSVEFNTYWIPCTWFISLLKETRKSNRISDAQGLKIIMEEFNEFRSKCGLLWSYDWVSIPLVYTQVVTIATYSFFLAALVGRQYVDAAKKPLQMEIDIYVPVFTILQFFFFMGLLKVAEQLINPFGDDDEDFELNWLIDRHTKVSYLGVDTLMANSPPLVKDMYFDQVDLTLPYTEASVAYKKKTYRGSVHNMQVPEEKHTMFLPEIVEEDEGMSLGSSRVSVPNLHSCSSSGKLSSPPTPAAGIWRSHNQTSASSIKTSEVANEFEGDNLSCQHLEVDLSSSKPVSSVFSEASERSIRSTRSSFSPVRPQKQFNRSESVPVKKAVFNVGDSVSLWSSSSTLGQSEVSVHWSEPSTEQETCPSCPVASTVEKSLLLPQEHSCVSQTSDVSINETQDQKKHLHFFTGSAFQIKMDDTIHKVSNLKYWSKIKSCPKLVPIKRQNSMNSGKKKGVRWKPMIESPSEIRRREQMRRMTVDAIPTIKELFHLPSKIAYTNDKDKFELPTDLNKRCKVCNNTLNFLPNGAEQYNRFDLNTESTKNGSESVPNLIGSQNRPHFLKRNVSIGNKNFQQDGADSCNIQSVPNISFSSPTNLSKGSVGSTVDLNSERNSIVSIQLPTNLNRRFSTGILRDLNHCVDFKTYSNSQTQWEHVSLPNIALSLQSPISQDKSSSNSNSSIDLSSFHSCSLEVDVVVEKIPLSESGSTVADIIGKQNISNQIEDNHKPKVGNLLDSNIPNIPSIFCDATEDADIYLTVRSDISHDTRHNLLDVLPWKSQSRLLENNHHKRNISSESEDVEMVQIVVDSQSKD